MECHCISVCLSYSSTLWLQDLCERVLHHHRHASIHHLPSKPASRQRSPSEDCEQGRRGTNCPPCSNCPQTSQKPGNSSPPQDCHGSHFWAHQVWLPPRASMKLLTCVFIHMPCHVFMCSWLCTSRPKICYNFIWNGERTPNLQVNGITTARVIKRDYFVLYYIVNMHLGVPNHVYLSCFVISACKSKHSSNENNIFSGKMVPVSWRLLSDMFKQLTQFLKINDYKIMF